MRTPGPPYAETCDAASIRSCGFGRSSMRSATSVKEPPDNPFAIDQELAEQLTASLLSHLLVPGVESRGCDDGNLALQAALNLGESIGVRAPS